MSQPHTVFLNGSPHKNGNGMAAANVFAEFVGGSSRVIHLYEADIRPCGACGACAASGACNMTDDMNSVLADVVQADNVVLVSPVHFSSLTAPLIAFIGRLQPIWLESRGKKAHREIRGNRFGALLVTGGSCYPNMFRPARAVAAAAFNTLSLSFAGMVGISETDRTPAADNVGAMERVRRLARLMHVQE